MNLYKEDWKQCMIMHLDRPAALIQKDGTCTVYDAQFLPYNLYLETADETDVDACINNLGNFYCWCASRVLLCKRKHAKEILSCIGGGQTVTDHERARIAMSMRCLTMTDVFWIRLDGEPADYLHLNLFEHPPAERFAEVSLWGKELPVRYLQRLAWQDVAGDMSTSGVAPKAWIYREGSMYLLKTEEGEEVQAELLASQIARCFDARQVLYEPLEYDGQIVSASKLVTSLDYSIVPMEHVEIYAANHDVSIYDLIQQIDPYGYFMMNIIDYLVGNTDRHWGNWGFLVDNHTNLPVHLYPLMDFNQSFRCYDRVEGDRCLTSVQPMSQKEAAIAAVQAVGLNQICGVKKEWFSDLHWWEMFERRLTVLKGIEKLCK